MHIYLESSSKYKCDCVLSSLSWMGKVPDNMPEEDGWKLNRILYYQEGWLATGNARGIVGVTYTSSHSKKGAENPARTNYNLRGHRSEVVLVRWNEPYQKLATCDASGVIFVWIKFEGRWSIELINDRNTPVTHFSWSHDGRMALICYQDGFVLVGSAAGQRYWSMTLSLQSTITAGSFSPDDYLVLFGTSSGLLVAMNVHGVTVFQGSLLEGTAISQLQWSCPKFKMEESDESTAKTDESPHLLAVVFVSGLIYLLRTHDDVSPVVIDSKLQGPRVEWTNSGETLAVAGSSAPEINGSSEEPDPGTFKNVVKFYTKKGTLRYIHRIPPTQHPVSALTWGHNDKRIFVATGATLHVGRVIRRVASLQLLCRMTIRTRISLEENASRLPLPKRLRSAMAPLYTQTIRCCIPDENQLREYVSRPPTKQHRLHCTMIRHEDALAPSPGACYTLYLEYLGGLVPLLKGKRTSKIRPEFVIYDPQADKTNWSEVTVTSKRCGGTWSNTTTHHHNTVASHNSAVPTDSSTSEYEDICASPRLHRRRKQKRRLQERIENETDDLVYLDTLPEHGRLVEVTSNIWGTKFKIHGLADHLPSNLGQVMYKTSLLHLQPRQMTATVTELRDDVPPRHDPSFNPNVFSDDEEESGDVNRADTKTHRNLKLRTDVPSIAPMTPRRTPSCYSTRDLLSPPPQPPWDNMALESAPSIQIKSSEHEPEAKVDLCYNDLVSNENSPKHVNIQSPQENNNPENTHVVIRNALHNDVLRFIDDESGDSEDWHLPPTPRKKKILHRAKRVRSRSVGHLHTMDSIRMGTGRPSALLEQLPFTPVKNIDSLLAYKQTSKSECEKDLMKKESSNKLCDIGKSHSLDSSLLILNDKDVPLKEDSPFSCRLLPIDRSYISTLHSSPSRIHVIKNPSHSTHIYENINIYTTAFGASCFNPLEYLSLKNSRCLKHTSKLSSSNSPQRVHHLQGCTAKDLGRDAQKLPYKRRLCCKVPQEDSVSSNKSKNSPHATPRSVENRFLRGLRDAMLGDRLVSLSREQGNISAHPSPPPTPKHVPSPEVSRRNMANLSVPLSPPHHLSPSHTSKSSPSTPANVRKHRRNQSSSPIRKHFLNSPLLSRRRQKRSTIESSDEEVVHCSSDVEHLPSSASYKDLETFQKKQLRNKLRRAKGAELRGLSQGTLVKSQCVDVNFTLAPRHRQFVMYNKAPIWNENSQVYQLDFGGRVTQESAKNFQIEFKGNQVMQFGRIDINAYTLDFQYPFSAIQAFAVALANVTQRLK